MSDDIDVEDDCPCGSGKTLADCCLPCVQREVDPKTAEQLMRSRYTAFVLCDELYLRYSWAPATCPDNIHINDDCNWLGLEVRGCSAGATGDAEGFVEFVARYKRDGKAVRIHERSRFERFEGRWVYVDGVNPKEG